MENTVKSVQRIEWVDFAKGITILLVIIGHTLDLDTFSGNLIRGLIFSFHMPLFFILSSTTMRLSSSFEDWLHQLKRAAIHLLIPAVSVFFFMCVVGCIRNHSFFTSISYWTNRALSLFFASGVKTSIFGREVWAIGMTWFLFALFIGRTIFDFLHWKLKEIWLLFITILIGIAGILLGKLHFLPLSADVALAVMPFLYFGYRLRNIDIKTQWIVKLILSLVIWLGTLYLAWPHIHPWTYLELAARRYYLFPICYFTAIAGTMFIAEFSFLCSNLKSLSKPLRYLGRNSLFLYMIHIIDSIWGRLYSIEGHMFLSILLRIVCDLIVFCIWMLLKHIIKQFINKKRVLQN